MNYDSEDFINLEGLIDYEFGLVRLIIEFLCGSTIKLNENNEALNFRLVCKKFKEEIDKLAHISVILPISKRKKRRNFRLPSGVSSLSMITKYDSYKIVEQDWKDIFGDELSNLESSVRHLRVGFGSIDYFPKFKCLKSISWEVGGTGYYEILENIPHKDLRITRYHWNYSIAHFTGLKEIEFKLSNGEHRLINEYLPPTIQRMTIKMFEYEVADIIDLSKFKSLKCLKIVVNYDVEQLIEELILPPSLNELYSEVKIEKINLHQCKNLGVLELK